MGGRHIRIRSYFSSDSHLLCLFLFHLLELCFSFFGRCNSLEARSVTLGVFKEFRLIKETQGGRNGELGQGHSGNVSAN